MVTKWSLGTYHHLQEASSVKTPPSSGPATLAHPKTAPMMPVKAGRRLGVAMKAMII